MTSDEQGSIIEEAELGLVEARTWTTISQQLINEAIAVGTQVVNMEGSYHPDKETTIDVLEPHGLYSDSELIVDIYKKPPENPEKRKRIAGYAFFQDAVTNHPNFFDFGDKDGFVKVSKEEIVTLIALMRSIANGLT